MMTMAFRAGVDLLAPEGDQQIEPAGDHDPGRALAGHRIGKTTKSACRRSSGAQGRGHRMATKAAPARTRSLRRRRSRSSRFLPWDRAHGPPRIVFRRPLMKFYVQSVLRWRLAWKAEACSSTTSAALRPSPSTTGVGRAIVTSTAVPLAEGGLVSSAREQATARSTGTTPARHRPEAREQPGPSRRLVEEVRGRYRRPIDVSGHDIGPNSRPKPGPCSPVRR